MTSLLNLYCVLAPVYQPIKALQSYNTLNQEDGAHFYDLVHGINKVSFNKKDYFYN
jgi:hypothetical protein